MGQERTSDLSRSIPAYLRGKLIDGDGKLDIGPALMSMPENVGFTSNSAGEIPLIRTYANDWSEEKKQEL